MAHPPVIDVSALVEPGATQARQLEAARAIDAAAREWGFFYADRHGVDAALIERVAAQARAFFAQDEAHKMRIPMSAGGLAWRGYFPAGGELTSGRPDWKEGLYLGSELGPEHPRVRDVAVFGIPDDDWGEQIKAVVEPESGATPDLALARELLAFCKERLAGFKCPKTIDFTTALPRDPNGKLYKRKLRDPYWEGRERAI